MLHSGQRAAEAEVISEEMIREAAVKVYATYNTPDYFNPWSMRGPRTRTGSGALIIDNFILTNAHIVSDVTFLQVRRYGDNRRYEAYVHSVSHQSDLALLRVEDPAFFEGITPLKFGTLPESHQEAAVYGFPLGGDALSITKGVVSRIEHQHYVHSSNYLLAGQIDAAINPGSSGGPVVSGGRIVGVTMQAVPQAQNIGYMVPVPLVQRFLEDVRKGESRGFPTLAVTLQIMENRDLRRYYQMSPDQTGMLVTSVIPGSPAEGIIMAEDVLLYIDNYQIGNDGTVEFRQNERTWLSYAVQKHHIGDTISVKVLRDGEIHSLDIMLSTSAEDHRLVPLEQYDILPTYYIYGGFVFTPLSKNLLNIWGDTWAHTAPRELVTIFQDNRPETPGEQVVLISRVLASDINDGYQDIMFWRVETVNGQRVRRMEELISLIEDHTGPYTVLENRDGKKIILDNEQAGKSHERILSMYRIGSDRSEDLR